jgi:hypothetical protein
LNSGLLLLSLGGLLLLLLLLLRLRLLLLLAAASIHAALARGVPLSHQPHFVPAFASNLNHSAGRPGPGLSPVIMIPPL